ncbi:MAG TPA: hypothetical protein VLL52_11290 [Anaerolineae bacterium]|nr:hypothetical protein [Anaerolineae bacterium]
MLVTACNSSTPVASPDDNQIAVGAEFAAYYQANDGSVMFGQPLTSRFVDPVTGNVWQYFEHMRLEYDGTNVFITPLGEWAWSGVADPVVMPTTTTGEQLSLGGFVVQDEFLRFYRTGKRSVTLGNPISPQIDEGGLQVQYFKNGRLEWQPAAAATERVQVGDLGRAHYLASGAQTLYETIIQAQPASATAVDEVIIEAQVQNAILYAGDEQVVFVEVKTPDGRPIPELTIWLEVTVEGQGPQPIYSLGQTNELGQLQGPIPLNDVEPGKEVTVLVQALVGDTILSGSSTVTFKLWW